MITKVMTLISVVSVLATSAMAADGDLVLPGEKWVAGLDSYICQPFQPSVARPEAYEAMDLQFERLSTDSTLDNVLLVATYKEDGADCRYSAILFADNAAFTVKHLDSKAYAPNGGSTCAAGKALIDSQFAGTVQYHYYGHPHHIALVLPFADAEKVCGAGATTIAPDFVLKKRIQQ